MNIFKKILFRELNFIKEEKSLFALIFLAPFFFAFFYSSVYISKVETDINIIVVDEDNSELSRTFTRYLDAHQKLAIYSNSFNYHDAETFIKEDKIAGFVFISSGFEKSIKQSKGFTVSLYLNNARFLTSNDINISVNEVAGTMNASIKLNYLQSNNFSKKQSLAQFEPIKIDIRSLYNFTESYGDFVIPGLLALILQQTLLIGISLAFTKEIEEKRTKELYELSNKSLTKAIILKSIFYIVLFSTISFFFFTVTFNLFSISLTGSAFALLCITTAYLISVSMFGFFLSTFLKRKIAVLQFFAFTSLPFFMASGYSWPKSAIYDSINWFMYLVPSTSYLESFICVTQKGQGFDGIYVNTIILIILAALYFTAGLYKIKKLPIH